jgi:hypothetical protein
LQARVPSGLVLTGRGSRARFCAMANWQFRPVYFLPYVLRCRRRIDPEQQNRQAPMHMYSVVMHVWQGSTPWTARSDETATGALIVEEDLLFIYLISSVLVFSYSWMILLQSSYKPLITAVCSSCTPIAVCTLWQPYWVIQNQISLTGPGCLNSHSWFEL